MARRWACYAGWYPSGRAGALGCCLPTVVRLRGGSRAQLLAHGRLCRAAGEEARRISQPALSVLGGDSEALWARFGETHRLLLDWLPHAEGCVVPGTTHFMQGERPRDTAEALAAFFARHPLSRKEE